MMTCVFITKNHHELSAGGAKRDARYALPVVRRLWPSDYDCNVHYGQVGLPKRMNFRKTLPGRGPLLFRLLVKFTHLTHFSAPRQDIMVL